MKADALPISRHSALLERLRGLRRFVRARRKTLAKRDKSSDLRQLLEAEYTSVAEGLRNYAKHNAEPSSSYPLLRRNIHRLEKGLCFPQQKGRFGGKYIEETVALYANALSNPAFCAEELGWAHGVLRAYFEVEPDDDAVVARSRQRFVATLEAASADRRATLAALEASHRPYPYVELDQRVGSNERGPEAFHAFATLCRARRSVRWFEDRPVPMDRVRAAVAAALQAPSACNRQPFNFFITRDRALIGKIAALPLGTAGYGDDLPALIVVVGDLSCLAEPRDRHLVYIDSALASMQLMLGLTAIGLASVPINWPDIPANHAALRRLLSLGADQTPVMMIGFGIPRAEGQIPFSAKRAVDDVLHEITGHDH